MVNSFLLVAVMEGAARHRRCQIIAATILLFSVALGLTCFSWYGLKNIRKVGKSTEVEDEGTFKGKELKYESGRSSALATEIGLYDASVPADKEDTIVEAAAWSSSNSSLFCGPNKMKFKVMGPGADELQLYMGNADPVPLSRMHETCGILVKQTPFGLILLVPYDGCGVKQNGTHVLTMRWRKSVVNITCKMLPNTDLSTTTEPVDDSLKTTGFHRALHRMKRGFRWHPIYDPCYQRRRFPFFHYFFSTPAPTTTTTTTTAAPTHPSLLYQHFFKKLLEYYPFYAHYFKRPRYHLPPYYQAYNPPEWHTYFQTTPKPKLFAHPFQKILAEYFTTPKTTPTTPTEPTVTSSTDCPQPRIGPSAKHSSYNFVPRALVGNSKIQQNEQNHISGYSQANPDAFWESFPLLYHSTSLVDPDLEDLTSK